MGIPVFTRVLVAAVTGVGESALLACVGAIVTEITLLDFVVSFSASTVPGDGAGVPVTSTGCIVRIEPLSVDEGCEFGDGVGVRVGVFDGLGVTDGETLCAPNTPGVGVLEGVGVLVEVGVRVKVGVGVYEGVIVGVFVGVGEGIVVGLGAIKGTV